MQGIETLITNLLVSRIERGPPEPKLGGSSPSWRTRLNLIEIAERLSLFESFFFICILKFTHPYPNFSVTLTKLYPPQKLPRQGLHSGVLNLPAKPKNSIADCQLSQIP